MRFLSRAQLYCPGKPPPLIGAGRVCTGSSKVGAGCEDSLKMGVCMSYTIQECIKACQDELKCESFVYYTKVERPSRHDPSHEPLTDAPAAQR